MSWCFEDEETPAADALLDRVAAQGAVVPSLRKLEIANALQVAIRRVRIDVRFRDRAIAQLGRIPIRVDGETDTHAWTSTLDLAHRFRLSAYDAAYLELAQRRSLPLATLDRALHSAAAALGLRCSAA